MNLKRFVLKRALPLGMAVVSVLVSSGCSGELQEENEKLSSTIISLEDDKKALAEVIDQLEMEKDDLEESLAELQEEISKREEENANQIKILENENTELKNQNTKLTKQILGDLSTGEVEINSEQTMSLFFENGVLSVDNVGEPFQFYLPLSGKNSAITSSYTFPKYFIEIEKNGKKYLADNDDYSQVYIAEYDEILLHDWWVFDKAFKCSRYYPYCQKDDYNFGTFVGVRRGDVYSYYTLPDFNCVLSNIDKRLYLNGGRVDDEAINTFMIYPYSATRGGTDEAGNYSGEAIIIPKGGINYLVDASDFTKILAEDVLDVKEHFDDSGKGIIEITHSDGMIDRYDASNFWSVDSDIMIR